MYVYRNVEARSRDHCCRVCVCSLTYPACAILLSVACPTVQYFFFNSHERRDFRGGEELVIMKCVF